MKRTGTRISFGIWPLFLCMCSSASSQFGPNAPLIIEGKSANVTELETSLPPISLLSNESQDYIDIRGVGDSGWSNTHEQTPLTAGFGVALDAFDPSGTYYRGDLTFMNWESVVGERCETFKDVSIPGKIYAFVSRAENLASAYARGFNLIGLTNNHTRDCFNESKDGSASIDLTFNSMKDLSKRRKWLWHGVASHDSKKSEAEVRTFKIKGRSVRVAFGSIYSGRDHCPRATCADDASRLLKSLSDSDADLRILSVHSEDSQERSVGLGEDFIKKFNGDIVFGHGPHSWAPVRFLPKKNGGRGVIFESLGNFIHPGLGSRNSSIIGRVLFDLKSLKLTQIQLIPLKTDGRYVKISKVSPVEIAKSLTWDFTPEISGIYSNNEKSHLEEFISVK